MGKTYVPRTKTRPERRKWCPEEDELLLKSIEKHGTKNWGVVAAGIKGRHPKQCRERWINHLDPNITKGKMTEAEWELVLRVHTQQGNRWSEIAKLLPGRTSNQIKNYWHTMARRQQKEKSEGNGAGSSGPTSPELQKESDSAEATQPEIQIEIPKETEIEGGFIDHTTSASGETSFSGSRTPSQSSPEPGQSLNAIIISPEEIALLASIATTATAVPTFESSVASPNVPSGGALRRRASSPSLSTPANVRTPGSSRSNTPKSSRGNTPASSRSPSPSRAREHLSPSLHSINHLPPISEVEPLQFARLSMNSGPSTPTNSLPSSPKPTHYPPPPTYVVGPPPPTFHPGMYPLLSPLQYPQPVLASIPEVMGLNNAQPRPRSLPRPLSMREVEDQIQVMEQQLFQKYSYPAIPLG